MAKTAKRERRSRSSAGGSVRRKKSPDQAYIDGFAPPRIKALDNLALEYREKVQARQQILAEEVEMKGKLMELMHKHELTTYPIPDTELEVILETVEETVKVRRRSKAKQNADAIAAAGE